MQRPRVRLIANRTLEDKSLVNAFREEVQKEHHDEQNNQNDKRSRVQLRRTATWLKEYQFKPGITGNPKGRPVVRKVSHAVINRLKEVEPETGMTYAELIAHALIGRAIQGDVAAAREVLEVSEGMLAQKIEVSSTMGIDIENATDEQLNQIISSFLESNGKGKEQGQYQLAQEEE